MNIRIRYHLRDEETSREVVFEPEDYFDPPDPGEVYDVRSVPRFDHAFEYLAHPPAEVRWTVLEITSGTDFWRIRSQLLDGRRSMMTHSESSDGTEEIIHSTEVLPDHWHTIRTLKAPGRSWAVVMNTLTVERPGVRTVREEAFEGSWTWAEKTGFGDVR